MNQTPPQQAIDEFVGAAHGDVATVKRLLSQYPDIVTMPASWGESAIQAAAQTGQLEIAQLLLTAGAPLDVCTAAMLGNVKQVEAFLKADPKAAHATGAHGLPVMYHAAVRGHTPVAIVLQAAGADINAGENKSTALHAAVIFGQVDMVKWLLANRANVNARDSQGRTPLDIASKNGNEMLRDLLSQNGGAE